MPRTAITPGDGDPRHGTTNGYTNLHCRCPDCRQAWAQRTRTYRNPDTPTDQPDTPTPTPWPPLSPEQQAYLQALAPTRTNNTQ